MREFKMGDVVMVPADYAGPLRAEGCGLREVTQGVPLTVVRELDADGEVVVQDGAVADRVYVLAEALVPVEAEAPADEPAGPDLQELQGQVEALTRQVTTLRQSLETVREVLPVSGLHTANEVSRLLSRHTEATEVAVHDGPDVGFDDEPAVVVELRGVRLQGGRITPPVREYRVLVSVPVAVVVAVEVEATDEDEAGEKAMEAVRSDGSWSFDASHNSFDVEDAEADVYAADVNEVEEV